MCYFSRFYDQFWNCLNLCDLAHLEITFLRPENESDEFNYVWIFHRKIELIFIWKVLHQDIFFKDGVARVVAGNGLLASCLLFMDAYLENNPWVILQTYIRHRSTSYTDLILVINHFSCEVNIQFATYSVVSIWIN